MKTTTYRTTPICVGDLKIGDRFYFAESLCTIRDLSWSDNGRKLSCVYDGSVKNPNHCMAIWITIDLSDNYMLDIITD